MKIDNKTASLTAKPPAAEALAANPAKTGAQTAASVPAAATNVTLGTVAGRLRNLEQAAASAPLVDANRVAEIKQAISEGRFQVNASVVAERLISTVQDLISASKR